MLFAQALTRARELRGMTQSELARKMQVQPSYINHLETGRREPSLANLRLIAEALNVSTDVLVMPDRFEPEVCGHCKGQGVTWLKIAAKPSRP